MISYATAKLLKEAGFKSYSQEWNQQLKEILPEPTLEELIEACGFYFVGLYQMKEGRTKEGYLELSGWKADAMDAEPYWEARGETPSEAVANLWLKLNSK